MDRATELRLIDEIGDLLERRSTAMTEAVQRIPARPFVDPERLAVERERLFRHYPLVVGLSAGVAKPGDFFTADLAGLPLLVVRGDDGELRGFVNVCRHRGNTVCEAASGNRRAFSCEYHAWTYDRQGQCQTFIDAEAFTGLERSDYGLVALPVEDRHGLVWARPVPGGEPVDVAAFLGAPFDSELAGYERYARHVFHTTTITQPFNWKLGIDTFCELFHLGFLHTQSLVNVFVGNCSGFEAFGPHFRETVIRTTFPEMLKAPEAERTIFPHTAIVYYLFPNTILTWQVDHLELWQFFPAPGGDDECVVTVSLLVEEPPSTDGAIRHWQRNWEMTAATVFGEDFAAMTRIQANLETGVLDHLVYGRNEVGLQHFHRSIDEAVAQASP